MQFLTCPTEEQHKEAFLAISKMSFSSYTLAADGINPQYQIQSMSSPPFRIHER